MTEKQESTFILTRNELIALLRKAGYRTGVVGVNLPELKQADVYLQEIYSSAEKSLLEKQFITVSQDSGQWEIRPDLGEVIDIAASREKTFLLVIGAKGVGQLLFIYDLYQDSIIEHTLPKADVHRFARIEDLSSFFNRIQSIIPLLPVDRDQRVSINIPQPDMEELIQSTRTMPKEKVLDQAKDLGFPEDQASIFLQAMRNPSFTLSLACFQIVNAEIVKTISMSVFADENSAWGIWPDDMEAAPPQLSVFPSGINDVVDAMTDWIEA